ncbi:MAG: type II toxin-antitoxin system RelE/ParE family toxin [Acetobacteraceae bacterium]|nr:type II toxin-antitoxin system RelE/ParE family toxin [Acetobacteraceae bacterium]
MTGRYTISPRARRDIEEIWAHTGKHWGTDQAEFYTRQIGRDIARVAEQPAIGRACPEVRAGYRKYPSGSHVLFYRLIEGGIDVVRILHERMDFGRHF